MDEKEVGCYDLEFITSTEEEKVALGCEIHQQLVGNEDYINCAIIVNIEEPCKVRVAVFRDAKPVKISINFATLHERSTNVKLGKESHGLF